MTDSRRPLPNLASQRLGAAVLAANDEFFAAKENLIKDADPIWDSDRYTDHGKWMDGWETRRRRQPGHDWCVIRLAAEGVISEVVVDTAHFTGNYPESCAVEGCSATGGGAIEDLEDAAWQPLVAQTPLEGDTEHRFPVAWPFRVTHLRLNIYPDGGVARLRAHGRVIADPDRLAGESVALSSILDGARIVDLSDCFFSAPENLLLPDEPQGMHDGWETRRRRGPGNDWMVIRLAVPGVPRRLEASTRYFKGNAPGSCSVEVLSGDYRPDLPESAWTPLLGQQPLEPDSVHVFDELLEPAGPVRDLRLQIYPDGGMARLRVYGDPAVGKALVPVRLERLNTAPPAEAQRLLRACCGAGAWVESLADSRPFASAEELVSAAGRAFDALDDQDWLEAFEAHPEIGRGRAEVDRGRQAAEWSAQEQEAAGGADAAVREALAGANAAYRDKFGFPFIISAVGLPADEILDSVRSRIENSSDQELQNAAAEERKIANNRLRRLLDP